MLEKSVRGDVIQCIACNRYCTIKNGESGYCGVRINENGKLHLIVANKPVAIFVDPIEKKPLFHFLPGSKSFSLGTLGCNFACSFCQNWDISQAPHEAKENDPKHWKEYFQKLVDSCQIWEPKKVVEAAISKGCKSISFTYNEPTIFAEYAVEVMKEAKKHGLKGIFVTNGYESIECWDYVKGYIDAANIDLKAYNEKFYKKLCNVPNWEKIKESIVYARKSGIWVEITTLIIPGWNDSEKELADAAKFLASIDKNIPWHLTAFHPDYKLTSVNSTEPDFILKAREIGLSAGLNFVYCGNIPHTYFEYESTLCPICKYVLIERYGMSVSNFNLINGHCPKCKEKICGVFV